MLPGQVPELVGQHRPELLGRQRLQLHEAEEQVAAVPAERPEAGDLGRGAALVGQQHAVQTWCVEVAREPSDQREELGGIGAPDADAIRTPGGHPERAEHHAEEKHERCCEGQDTIRRSVEAQRPHQQRDRASEPDQDEPHVAVSREGERRHSPRIALGIALGVGLALADERLELLCRQRHAGPLHISSGTSPSPERGYCG